MVKRKKGRERGKGEREIGRDEEREKIQVEW